jgi:hypothetical protein
MFNLVSFSTKKETVRLVDDATKHNMGLIARLRNCKELESAWYLIVLCMVKLLMKRE